MNMAYHATGLAGFGSDDVRAGSVRWVLLVEPPRKKYKTVLPKASVSLFPENSQIGVCWAEEFTARQML